MNRRETIAGFVYLAFQFLLLPELLLWCNGHLEKPLSDSLLNVVFYTINFLAMLLLFHRFLGNGLFQALYHPVSFCQAVVLGLAAYFSCRYALSRLVGLLAPTFTNYNDSAIAAMDRGNPTLMLIATTLLVPPYEECVYRGLIFRNLYGKSPWAAYGVSMFVFAVIHILGYVGRYSPLELGIAIAQYLPAGLCLAWSYQKADTIFAPIAIHAIINYITITCMR